MEHKLETNQEALERLKLEVGDTVKVLEKAESQSRGWDTNWINSVMDNAVGKIGTVTNIDTTENNYGVELEIEGVTGPFDKLYYYPAYVLEVVKRANSRPEFIEENPIHSLSSEGAISYSSPKPITVMDEAKNLIYGDREKDYGKTSDNFKDIAKGWEVITKATITPEQVGLMMAWLKICRANQDNCEKRDSLIDLCGYAGCIEKVKNNL